MGETMNEDLIKLNNEMLNLIDDFIIDHAEEFTANDIRWIMDQLDYVGNKFYEKFQDVIDEDYADFPDYNGGEEED